MTFARGDWISTEEDHNQTEDVTFGKSYKVTGMDGDMVCFADDVGDHRRRPAYRYRIVPVPPDGSGSEAGAAEYEEIMAGEEIWASTLRSSAS